MTKNSINNLMMEIISAFSAPWNYPSKGYGSYLLADFNDWRILRLLQNK